MATIKASTIKSNIRKHLISKGMEKILHWKNELFKNDLLGYPEQISSDESGLASVRISAGRVPTFSAEAFEIEDGVFISIDLEKLKIKDPELFDTLLAKYPTEAKTRGADTVSVTCTQKCYALAAEELGISKEELEEIQRLAKLGKVK